MSEPTYRDLINTVWMSGRLAVVKRDGDVVLVKKYSPVAVAVWCLSVFGVLGYFIYRYEGLGLFVFLWLGMGVMGSVFFTWLAVWMSRKPPILIARHGGAIELPQYGCTLSPVSAICYGPVAYHRRANEEVFGGCLYVKVAHWPELSPVFIDDTRGDVRRVAKKLAEVLGVAFETQEDQKI